MKNKKIIDEIEDVEIQEEIEEIQETVPFVEITTEGFKIVQKSLSNTSGSFGK